MAQRIFLAALALAAAACAPVAPTIFAQTQAPDQKSGEDPNASAARPTRAEVFAANSVEGSRYSNRALGLTFEIPNKMGVESAPEPSGALPETSGRGTDPPSNPVQRQAQEQTIHLLSLADHSPAAASSPAQILVLAYDLGAEKYSNQEIVAEIAAGMSASPGEWQASDAPHEQSYGGKKFWQQGLKGAVGIGSRQVSVYVEILATQCRGYAVAWTVTAATEERLAALTKIFPTIRFEAATSRTP